MTQKQEIGKKGEEEAVKYLQKRGYTIIEQNYWKPWGELDIIAQAPDQTLVFVEVKTIQTNLTNLSSNGLVNSSRIAPEDNVTSAKLRKLRRAASLYAGANQKRIDDDRGWRIDLVAILLDPATDKQDIQHYENI